MSNENEEIKQAMQVLTEAMKKEGTEPGSYAHSWHCNVAMAVYDTIGKYFTHRLGHMLANEAATRFMKICFKVDTKV